MTAEMVDGLEDAIDEYVARTHMPEEFIVLASRAARPSWTTPGP